MDTTAAPSPRATQQDHQPLPADLQQALCSSTDLLSRTDPQTATAQDSRAALATAHEITQHLARWQALVAERRDAHVLHLWGMGQSQAEIAEFLGVPKATVHAILAERRAQATPAEQDAYARRAAEEFEAEALAEMGNLFSMQESDVA